MAYGTTTFSWDAAGRLIKIASGKGKLAISASYLYNGLGQRLIKDNPALVNPPHRFVFDPAGHLIGEYDKTNSVRQETVWLGDTPVAVVKPGPTSGQRLVYYVQADHLNTPRVILDNAHTAVWRWDNSDAFGVGQPNEDPDGDGKKFEYNPRFPGQYFDRETGLHYNYFRDYDPRTGRYVEADPIGLAGGVNLYLYANAAPTMYTDPMGLTTMSPGVLGESGGGIPNPYDVAPYPSIPKNNVNLECVALCAAEQYMICAPWGVTGMGIGKPVGGAAASALFGPEMYVPGSVIGGTLGGLAGTQI